MKSLLELPNHGAAVDAASTMVRFTGSKVCLDQETVDEIRHQLLALADTPGAPELILDFANVDYVAGLALGTLITLHKRLAAADRRLTLCNLRPLVREVFAITRLDCLLNLKAEECKADTRPAHPPDRSPPGVLVGDDDEVTLDALGTGLRDMGLRVWMASHGQQAVELFRHNWQEITLVLLDALMRGLDGPDTLAAMCKISGSVRCCFTIGGFHVLTDSPLLRLGAIRVFRKPFSVAEVVQTLDQLARRSSQGGEVRWIEIPSRGE
jgi:anti-anti-sigma factor